MKIFYKIIFGFFVITSLFLFNSCDPFVDFYLTLSLNTDLNTIGAGTTIDIQSDFCLNDFDDYNDNKDKLEEIRYLSSAYLTMSATQGLQGSNLVLTLYQGDKSTVLFQYTQQSFVAADYINKPLEIKLTQQDINNLNQYLSNPEINNCFQARLQISNVQYQGALPFYLNGKVEFLTELKVKP
jgi:hypothetical protein